LWKPFVSDFAQSVKQQADIVKVIEGYIRLRKAGAQRYTGLCPFHKEKSPSFSVHAGQQFYYCFGCHESGDVFSFVGKIENVTFPEAVRIVAQKCGIPLPKREFSSPEQAAEARLRTRLLELHEIAVSWFEEQLASPGGALAREYLSGRGLDPKGIKEFRIGYAPDSFNALRDRLSGIADQDSLRASGLFSAKEIGAGPDGQPQFGPLYDRFRKRVMFPIANESGRVIAFTARLLGSADGDKAGPKYLNSPETPLYSKSKELFNLDKAKAAIRRESAVLLVEGQMDCIRVYVGDSKEPGIQNVIATSGTAFTEQQVAVLKRHFSKDQTARVFVVFDPDTAGENAKEKSIDLLGELASVFTTSGFKIHIVSLEDGLDPDRFIRERGMYEFKRCIRNARLYTDFLFERARKLFPGATADQKVNAMNYLLPHIQKMPEAVERGMFAADAAQKLGIDSAIIREQLRIAALRRRGHIEAQPSALTGVEKILLRALAVTDPDLGDSRQVAKEAILSQPEWFEHLEAYPALYALAGRFAQDPMEAVQDSGQRSLLAAALMDETKPPSLTEVESAIQQLEERAIEAQLRDVIARIAKEDSSGNSWEYLPREALRDKIAGAEYSGDLNEVVRLTQKKLELDQALRKLRNRQTGDSAA
jgi:DNA primase